MKEERLFRAIGEASEAYLAECEAPRRSRVRWALPLAAAACACLALLWAAARGIPLPGISLLTEPNPSATSEGTALSTASPVLQQTGNPGPNAQGFTGFLLTAYAPGATAQTLTAAYARETVPTRLQPQVETPLAQYSPLMSCVPGLPFTIGLDDATAAYTLTVRVDRGILCRWDPASGIVTECGKETACAVGETLFWSPLEADAGVITAALIRVSAWEGSREAAGQSLLLTADSQGTYTATLGELETY